MDVFHGEIGVLYNYMIEFLFSSIDTGYSWSDDPRDRCYDEACVSNDM